MRRGCLAVLVAFIVVLGIPVSWLWYRTWHDGRVNAEREERAVAALRDRTRATATATAAALDASDSTDPDALTEVIWRRTADPVITYDAARRELTATATRFARYDERNILGGGPVRATRCFVFTYTHPSGRAWTSRLSQRDDDTCRPATDIDGLARLAEIHIEHLPDTDLTRAGIQQALGRRTYDVRSVTREGGTVTVRAVVSDPRATIGQCCRFTRSARGSVTTVPASSCGR